MAYRASYSGTMSVYLTSSAVSPRSSTHAHSGCVTPVAYAKSASGLYFPLGIIVPGNLSFGAATSTATEFRGMPTASARRRAAYSSRVMPGVSSRALKSKCGCVTCVGCPATAAASWESARASARVKPWCVMDAPARARESIATGCEALSSRLDVLTFSAELAAATWL